MQGLDLFEIRSCVPKTCLEQVYWLMLELTATLSKSPNLKKREVGEDILYFTNIHTNSFDDALHKPVLITGQKFDTDAAEWTEMKCIKIQKELEEKGTVSFFYYYYVYFVEIIKGDCGTDAYLAACERLAYVRFSRSNNRSVLGWQKEGVRWLLRAEALLGGGLLADGIILSFLLLLIFINNHIVVDMGLGKTLQSLLLYKSYHAPVGPTLILCKPVSILINYNQKENELLFENNKIFIGLGLRNYFFKITSIGPSHFIFITQIWLQSFCLRV